MLGVEDVVDGGMGGQEALGVHAATTPAQRLGLLLALLHPAVSAFPVMVFQSEAGRDYQRPGWRAAPPRRRPIKRPLAERVGVTAHQR